MSRNPSKLAVAIALAACAQAAPAEWQCHSGAPGVRAAPELLERAGRIYPSQLLGVLRSGGRVLLVNSSDDGWSERVRQGLMELRLAEPDVTAARRFQAAAAGASAADVPNEGEFVCLERARAARHGLTLAAGGQVLLAAGRSVHLVDPYETAIVVVVKAAGSEPLDFREIIALSGRSGIYAGLAGKRARPDAAPAAQRPDEPIVVALGPSGRLGEIVVTPRVQDSIEKIEEKPVAARVATAPAAAQAPALPAAETPPVRVVEAAPRIVPAPAVEAPLARVVKAEVPADPPAAKPAEQEASVPAVVAVAVPASVAAPVRAAAGQGARPLTGQSYEEYARTMRSLMALRRSGGVRSISELTYVHPAVEDLRARR